LKSIGIQLLGVWSIVLSTSSLAILANFGISDSVVRFVALYSKDDDKNKMYELIFTSSLFLLGLSTLIVAVIYPFASFILKLVIPIKYLKDALSILPYSVCCLIVNALNGVYSSTLDGIQKNYIRNLIFAISSVLLLVCTIIFVPRFGLKGVAIAQVIQSLFALITCACAVIYKLRFNPLKWNWSKSIFKQIFSYGAKFQFISLAALLNEPVTKILLSKFGGLAFTGYYEMANRLLMQARGVIVNGTQSLLPVMVNLDKEHLSKFYKKTISNVLFFSLSAICLILSLAHVISLYWIGSYQPVFYYVLIILASSVIISLLTTPSYFYFMAKANLNILIKSHLISSFVSVIFSYILGYFIGGYGVIFGWLLSVICGSIYLFDRFDAYNKINFFGIWKILDIVFCCLIIAIVLLNLSQIIKANVILIDLISSMGIITISGFYFMRFKLSEILNKQ
jgi:O-antigen/teichoic acid export membrane protein